MPGEEINAELLAALQEVAKRARKMPRATPGPGGNATEHHFTLEAGVVWMLDAALTKLDDVQARATAQPDHGVEDADNEEDFQHASPRWRRNIIDAPAPLARFTEALRVLDDLDRSDLEQAGVIERTSGAPGSDASIQAHETATAIWLRFANRPLDFFLRADPATQAKLWALVQAKLPPSEPDPERVALDEIADAVGRYQPGDDDGDERIARVQSALDDLRKGGA